ncbi:hypothetical protein PVK63_05885 [Aliivibrio sp. S2TY2]|uniref:hypothetical protein n=1 Tax=Aliivibrio TaxID=511678 RepID=UPI0013EA2DBA|nr:MULTISPECIES: hypothetical protein [Aliivibrio]MDD9174398.1 hypothetical protein [Aliivibrio sp. S3TY1]MDD9191476.1 hypothetical protein [Aliivibrio sp. S2TY2]
MTNVQAQLAAIIEQDTVAAELTVDASVSDKWVDLVERYIDIAIRAFIEFMSNYFSSE